MRLGQTRFVSLEALVRANHGQQPARDSRARPLWVGLNAEGQPVAVANHASPETPWKLKLSGRPVNLRGKSEGVFLLGQDTLTLPAALWAAYSGRNVHGDRRELKKGDLVWLEPTVADSDRLESAEDVQSLQWSRWGKRGQSIQAKIPPHIVPDYERTDSKVDEITAIPAHSLAASSFDVKDSICERFEHAVGLDASGMVSPRDTIPGAQQARVVIWVDAACDRREAPGAWTDPSKAQGGLQKHA